MARDRNKPKSAPVEELLQMVTFQVGSEEFGLEIGVITEVIRPLRITALPRMPQFIEGVINLRGTIIPVVDLRKRFDVPAAGDGRAVRMIITRGAMPGATGAKSLLGLVVDRVREVLHVAASQVDKAPDAARGRGTDFISGVVKMADRLVILVDITCILTSEERAALEEAGNAHA